MSTITKEQHDELCVAYASMILFDGEHEITPEAIHHILHASNNEVEPYWPTLFSSLLSKEGKIVELISTGGAAAGAAAAAPGAAAGAAGAEAEKVEEKGKEEEEEAVSRLSIGRRWRKETDGCVCLWRALLDTGPGRRHGHVRRRRRGLLSCALASAATRPCPPL
ncbi:unnamed protein product [Phytophthora lilii]|uniref:Unnamed protein product n=1 Tax=Phytophthora lilii TaxID=2077276 RepID=A0A9W6YDS1_9STRA|nr:unnamed protein product [Phytophthora lilii]